MRKVGALLSPLVLLLVISLKPALAQTTVSDELNRNNKRPALKNIGNVCSATHVFELSESPEMAWFSIIGGRTSSIGPRSVKQFTFEFDSTGLEVGIYRGALTIACIDCANDPRCTQKQFALNVQLTVTRTRQELESLRGKFVEGQFLVSFESKLSGAIRGRIREFERKYRLKSLKVIKLTPSPRTLVLFAVLDQTASVPLLVTQLEREPGVSAQPNFIYTPMNVQKDDYVGEQYGPTRINAHLAQRHSSGQGVRVALLDTGVDDRHQDLNGSVSKSRNFTDEKSYREDTHGTQVAGIIVAAHNGFGIDGIAPKATLISIKVLKSSGWKWGTTDTIVQGVKFALKEKSHVINMSFGSDEYDQQLNDSVQEAVRRGVVVVAAAGNDGPQGKPSYPAALDEVIAVSAVDPADSFYAKGTQGVYIDLAAPGVDILSTAPDGAYQPDTGTSLSAPHVTGVVALLLSKRPGTSPKRIQTVLEETAKPLGAGGKDILFGSGLVDACKALEVLLDRGGLCK